MPGASLVANANSGSYKGDLVLPAYAKLLVTNRKEWNP